jgi:hypothetical protein
VRIKGVAGLGNCHCDDLGGRVRQPSDNALRIGKSQDQLLVRLKDLDLRSAVFQGEDGVRQILIVHGVEHIPRLPGNADDAPRAFFKVKSLSGVDRLMGAMEVAQTEVDDTSLVVAPQGQHREALFRC